MNRISAVGEAAGKVILFGEHAVVHGTDAVATALPTGVRAEVTAENTPFNITVPAWDFRVCVTDDTPHAEAFRALLETLPTPRTDLSLTVTTELIPRAGLGASAALAGATARACLAAGDTPCDYHTLFRAVQASETVFHGTPSGLDATLALRGGTVLFSKSKGPSPVENKGLPLQIVHSGAPGDTRRTVARFAAEMNAQPKRGNDALRRICEIVADGTRALARGDLPALGALMTQNHRILNRFGVSTPALDTIVDIALENGAYGAKLTGGGGGGCAIVLPSDDGNRIANRLNQAGYRVLYR